MDMIYPVLLLLLLLVFWTVLPFAPALRELQEKRDVEPVRVVQDSEVDVHYFARGYRSFVQRHLREPLARARAERRLQEGRLEDGTPYVVLDGDLEQEPPREDPAATSPRLILSAGMLRLPARTVYPLELYAERSVIGGETSAYRAILAGEDIDLGRGTVSLRWLHAGGSIRIAEESHLHGRVSADRLVRMAASTRFERVYAPRIVFGEEAHSEPAPAGGSEVAAPLPAPLEPKAVRNLVQVAAGRWLVKGRLEVPARQRVEADLVATEDADIGEGTHVLGSLKSHRDLFVRRGAVIEGSVVSGRDLHLEAGCRIHGPVLAEGVISLGPGCEIGAPREPTTVSARTIRALAPVVTHGTVWAHLEGIVLGAPEETRT